MHPSEMALYFFLLLENDETSSVPQRIEKAGLAKATGGVRLHHRSPLGKERGCLQRGWFTDWLKVRARVKQQLPPLDTHTHTEREHLVAGGIS